MDLAQKTRFFEKVAACCRQDLTPNKSRCCALFLRDQSVSTNTQHLRKMFQQRIFKFLLGGGIAAAFNLLLIFYAVEFLEFNTPLLRNCANAIAIELSLIFSFFVYRIWVWPGERWNFKSIVLQQIPVYHLAMGAAICSRIFIIFPLLDRLGINYKINTFIGILIGALLNYLLRDRLVFTRQDTADKSQDLYYPEGLPPALTNSSPAFAKSDGDRPDTAHNRFIRLFSLVIPAHNEEGSIEETIHAITTALEMHNIEYEIVAVNDNSRDRTELILQKLSTQNPRIRYLNNYYPNGFGFAIRCGLESFQGDAVAIVMADCSDSPQNIIDYYDKLQEGYECVFGSRFIKGGKVIDYPSHKLAINRLANLFVATLFGIKYNDITNAFKAYRRQTIEGIFPLLSHHFNLTVEMPLKAITRGYSYAIVPITWQNRKTGVSKLKIKEMGSRYLFIVLYIFLEKILSRGDYIRQNSDARLIKK